MVTRVAMNRELITLCEPQRKLTFFFFVSIKKYENSLDEGTPRLRILAENRFAISHTWWLIMKRETFHAHSNIFKHIARIHT